MYPINQVILWQGWFCPQGYWAMSGDIPSSLDWRGGATSHKARVSPPTTEIDPAPGSMVQTVMATFNPTYAISSKGKKTAIFDCRKKETGKKPVSQTQHNQQHYTVKKVENTTVSSWG